ncbi:MAG: flagellar hook protein FliD [Arcobacter sp.]|nr:MAG: flagellar hook protein FliD [Arcobacter sp.]
MAEGVLGLGAGASGLSSELLEKLRTADTASKINPIETSIENITKERESIATITEKLDAFYEAVKPLDLFVAGGSNAFTQISANSQGDSVLFDAEDINSLKLGTTTIEVTTLAKQDIFQTATFTDVNAIITTTALSALTIGDSAGDVEFITTGKSFQALADEINANEKYEAAIEQVGNNDFRIIIKSKDLGEANKLTITDTNLGTPDDLGLGLAENYVQVGSDLDATVNGVNYVLSTNDIALSNGLKITALKVDSGGSSSTISIARDNSSVEEVLTNLATSYNALVAAVDSELYDTDSNIDDKASLRTMMTGIKDFLFNTYGSTDDGSGGYISDKSIFNYGFELSKDGSLTVNSEDLNEIISDDFEGLKDLFVGEAGTNARGLGTQLKEHIDFAINSSSGGILTSYIDLMDTREKALEKDKEKAVESLDNKYKQMALEFAAYGGIIASFESSFSALSLMISQSVSTG